MKTEIAPQVVILLRQIAQTIVDDEEAVQVEASTMDKQTLFRLFVAQRDMGIAIGSQGRMAAALRTLLNEFSLKYECHFSLSIEQAPATSFIDDRDSRPGDSHASIRAA
jgi:predicted RNA-binding protein YlqC (UPF0109 family)